MKKKLRNIGLLLVIQLFIFSCIENFAAQKNRFPKPEFESGHTQPPAITPFPRTEVLAWLDVFVLLAALSLITWLILKKRSRKGVFWVSVFSVVYFGFFKEGCICSVGALQNVTLSLFSKEYTLPVTALLFFILPLLFTLFFGRTFCAGVCPLGAIQDLVSFKPLAMKSWIEKTLGVIPFIYLGLTLLYAATGTDFIICRYDPFVGFFRLNATSLLFLIGGVLLLIGIFISRPYCRFLCPYGALLNIFSRFSFKHMTITPSKCVNCNLCEHSCPIGAINSPTPLREKESPRIVIRRFLILAAIVPLLVAAGGALGYAFHENLAIVNPRIKLAQELMNGTNYGVIGEEAIEITAFKTSGEPREALFTDAVALIETFRNGSLLFGCFIGLVFGLTLIGLTIFKYRKDYSPNKATCHSCARCMDYCPVDAAGNVPVQLTN